MEKIHVLFNVANQLTLGVNRLAKLKKGMFINGIVINKL